MIFPEYQLEFHTLAVHGQLDNKKSPFDNEMDIILTQVELKPTDEKKISTIHNQPNQNADKSPTKWLFQFSNKCNSRFIFLLINTIATYNLHIY